MNQLSSFSMKNVAAVIIICAMLFAGGGFAATSINQETMPDISLPLVFVSTTYVAPPTDVMEDVTKPLEKAIVGLEGLKKITSTSADNFSTIQVELENGMDPDDAKREIESMLSNVRLPQGASEPKVAKFGFSSIPVYFLAMSGQNGVNQSDLDRIYSDIIDPTLSTLDGIDRLDAVGNQEATLNMKLNMNALINYGLTPTQVSQSIRAALTTSPAGSVDINGNTQMVRVRSDLNSIYALENMKVNTMDGNTVLLKDIAKVEAISESTFLSRLNGEPSISLTLYKAKDANTVEFVSKVETLVAGWEKEFPNVKFTPIMNQAKEVKKSINGMLEKGILGALFASIMILLFLKNIRMTIIVLVSIPLSILITLLVMVPLDITLNIMTLGGLTIAIGRVVDDSIVVIENIYSELVKTQERNESVIKLATSQVASAITSSTLATAGVFVPVAFVGGIVGEVFRPFAITIAAALLSSLLVALTVIPMLAKLLVLNHKKLKHHEDPNGGRFMTRYKKLLVWTLDNPKKTLLASVLLFVVTIGGTVPFLGYEFMPENSTAKDVQFSMKLPRETSFESMDQKAKEVERMLLEAKAPNNEPAFTFVNTMVGFDYGEDRIAYHTSIMAAASEASDTKELLEEMKVKIAELMPAGSEVTGNLTEAGGAPGGGADFIYMLKGEDLDQLMIGAERVKDKMREFPELTEIEDSLSEKKLELEVRVDQNKARLYGLSSAQILDGIRSWLAEDSIGDLRFDNTVFNTKVMLDDDFKDSQNKIAQFQIQTPTGATVYLSEVAQVRQIDSPASITRENQEQYVRITASIESKNKGGVSNTVGAALQSVELPNGVRTEVQGVSNDIQQTITDMVVAMAAAIGIVYLIMVIAFGNASAPFVILFSLPLAAIGGFVGLVITGETINITSLIGFLMLIGVVVTNAIVLVDRVQQNVVAGHSIRDSLIEGGISRFRPIIMTAGATITAMLPMALGAAEGGLISKGLSVVVIGGLTTSTILTLVVVPVMYELVEGAKQRVSRLFKRKKEKAAAVKAEPVTQ
ncbi:MULTISPECIES: efflux RND transporter permease subunit [unclassified Paenibacillus]|uniref:efflux RND transporter permease subunit n=1 Tax=unclassified Paenibacillus TaxID=185978 RepID=UPI001AE42161|nr:MULTISPECIES: efflux RND transporter permease subunit [unclassified Paenibacillus]MBP1156211.1 multidrug efflux pump subunit AcrB [Paenibacillus sp. PvP091]MBP1168403.1 multidrug efflux pump subunit AcrB [Paenibacillus sp. PvR098]MBP2439431.1 multidrug efflux pump subunit AcrB [Paenibacillus sp. PvP052]